MCIYHREDSLSPQHNGPIRVECVISDGAEWSSTGKEIATLCVYIYIRSFNHTDGLHTRLNRLGSCCVERVSVIYIIYYGDRGAAAAQNWAVVVKYENEQKQTNTSRSRSNPPPPPPRHILLWTRSREAYRKVRRNPKAVYCLLTQLNVILPLPPSLCSR